MSSSSTWRSLLYDFIRHQALPPEKFGHQPRLYALTQLIGTSEAYDDDIVYAACFLHDLGVFTGHRPEDPELLTCWDNTAYAVAQSPDILLRIGFPPPKIPAVLEAIRTHQPQHTPVAVEAVILRDADILEQLGAVAVFRTVCKIGRDTRFHTFTDVVAALTRALETLPALIRLPAARALAEPRVAALRTFLDATESEAGTLLL